MSLVIEARDAPGLNHEGTCDGPRGAAFAQRGVNALGEWDFDEGSVRAPYLHGGL